MARTSTRPWTLVAALWLAGCLIGGVPDVRDGKHSGLDTIDASPSDQTTEDEGDLSATDGDLGPFTLDLTCPDSTKPDLATMPSCKALIDRILDECCPNPKPRVNTEFAGMVCIPGADTLCQMVLDSEPSFKDMCSGFQISEDCQ